MIVEAPAKKIYAQVIATILSPGVSNTASLKSGLNNRMTWFTTPKLGL